MGRPRRREFQESGCIGQQSKAAPVESTVNCDERIDRLCILPILHNTPSLLANWLVFNKPVHELCNPLCVGTKCGVLQVFSMTTRGLLTGHLPHLLTDVVVCRVEPSWRVDFGWGRGRLLERRDPRSGGNWGVSVEGVEKERLRSGCYRTGGAEHGGVKDGDWMNEIMTTEATRIGRFRVEACRPSITLENPFTEWVIPRTIPT